MFDVTGKVAIVTGSSKGIGRAIAAQLALSGARVAISSRKQDACNAVAEELRTKGADVISVAAHAGRKADLQNLVDRTLAEWGRIDIVVCNAATNPTYGPMSELTDSVFDKVIETNVKGTLWLCNMVVPGMAERGEGSLILLSSIAGLRGTATLGVYGISKAAIAALTRNLAVEWGPKGIRVNAIAPGLVRTDFAKALIEDPVRAERARASTPLRRIGEPEDIAGIAHFLASDASRYMTGQTIVADGGETIA